MSQQREQDRLLRRHLTRLRAEHEDHWSYGSRTAAANRTALFQYPAMMVADMQRDLTEALLSQSDAADGPVFDPFVGSGTILGAGMALRRDVVGWDINPLAILICRVKAGPFYLEAFEAAAERVVPPQPRYKQPEERFPNWRHWFTDEVAQGLTTLREGILAERSETVRRFLWLCLAETVRLTSNSRTSTVKLHRRPAEQIASRPDPLDIFRRVSKENLSRLALARDELKAADVLSEAGEYQGDVQLRLGDTRLLDWEGPLSAAVVTSPPYGDNTSTVPYGQHAYLPLQWIEMTDIDPSADRSFLSSTYEIDRRSLGGEKRVEDADATALASRSPALDRLIGALSDEKRDRRNRVLAFVRDLDAALAVIGAATKHGAAAAWTVGTRRVGGQSVPLDQVLIDLASARGFAHIETLRRDIPQHRKRMAARNSAGNTMHSEYVVVLRKQDRSG